MNSDDTMFRRFLIALAIYLLASIATYGHAHNAFMREYRVATIPGISPRERAVYVSVPCAVLWPFYWSSVAWSADPPDPPDHFEIEISTTPELPR